MLAPSRGLLGSARSRPTVLCSCSGARLPLTLTSLRCLSLAVKRCASPTQSLHNWLCSCPWHRLFPPFRQPTRPACRIAACRHPSCRTGRSSPRRHVGASDLVCFRAASRSLPLRDRMPSLYAPPLGLAGPPWHPPVSSVAPEPARLARRVTEWFPCLLLVLPIRLSRCSLRLASRRAFLPSVSRPFFRDVAQR